MRVAALLFIIVIGVAASSAQEPFVFKVDVDLVTVDVGVTDPNGRPVTNLTRDDFEVYEDGRRQEIRSFASVDTPYNVLVLFDCSGSTRPSWPFLVEAMNRFARQLRPQDGVAVAQFGSSFRSLLGWTAVSTRNLNVGIRVDDPGCGGTNLYGALDRTLTELRLQGGRRGVIVLTDGQHDRIPLQRVNRLSVMNSRYVDPADDSDFQKLLRAIRQGGAAVYFVAVDTDLNPGPPDPARGYDPSEIYNMQQARVRMELLAHASGGRVSFPHSPGDVAALFEQIGADLGTAYGLGYTPANPSKDGKPRRIEVRVRDKGLSVRQSRNETF
jgi:Ca-activated chloride channel family protein